MLLDPSVAAGQHVDDMARAQEARAAATGVPIAHPTRAKIAEGLGKVEASIPMVGPWALSEGERAGKGDIAGAMTDVAAMGALPEVAKEAMPGGELSTQPEGAPAFPVASKLIPSAETAGKVAAAPIRGLGKVYNAAVDNPTLAGAAGGALIGGPFGGIVGGLEGAVGGGILGRGLKLLPRASDSITELGIPEHEVAVNHLTDTFKAAQKDHALAARAKADYAASEREGVQIPDSVQKKFDTTKAKMDEAEYHLDAAKQHSAAIKAGFGSVDDQLQHNVTQENYKAADAASNGAKAAPDALINVPKAPQGPLGSVQASTEGPTWRVGEQPAAAERSVAAPPAAEVPVAPKAQPTAEGVSPVAPKTTSAMEDLIAPAPKAAVPPTGTEPGLVGAEYKEAGGPGPEELHPVVKEQVALLRNAKLKALGKAYGLNPEEYDFSDRQRLTTSGSKHAVQRERFVDDLMKAMPDEEIQSIGRQAGDLEHNADMAGKHKAERAESLFPKLRKGTPVDEFGNPTVSGGSQGATEESVGEGLGNSGNSPPPLGRIRAEVPDLTAAQRADAANRGMSPRQYLSEMRQVREGKFQAPFEDVENEGVPPTREEIRAENARRGLNERGGKPQPLDLIPDAPKGSRYGSPSQVMPKLAPADFHPTTIAHEPYPAGSSRLGSTLTGGKDSPTGVPASETYRNAPRLYGGPGQEALPNPERNMDLIPERPGKIPSVGSISEKGRRPATAGQLEPLGAADQAVLKYAQTRPALGRIERTPGVLSDAQSDQLIPNKREGGPALTYDTKTGAWSKRAEGFPKVDTSAISDEHPVEHEYGQTYGRGTGEARDAAAKTKYEKGARASKAADKEQQGDFVSRMEEINNKGTAMKYEKPSAESNLNQTEQQDLKALNDSTPMDERLSSSAHELAHHMYANELGLDSRGITLERKLGKKWEGYRGETHVLDDLREDLRDKNDLGFPTTREDSEKVIHAALADGFGEEAARGTPKEKWGDKSDKDYAMWLLRRPSENGQPMYATDADAEDFMNKSREQAKQYFSRPEVIEQLKRAYTPLAENHWNKGKVTPEQIDRYLKEGK